MLETFQTKFGGIVFDGSMDFTMNWSFSGKHHNNTTANYNKRLAKKMTKTLSL